MTAVEPVAWVERTEAGLTRMWSGDLSAWANRPTDPEPLYSHATVDTLRAQLEAAVRFAANEGALRMAAEARAEAAEAECARLKRDVAELYEAMPSLPIAAETMDAATDWFTRYCVDFSREINAAQDAARTKEETK